MRRRFQGIKHTDCTCRTLFGRRNRYAAPVIGGGSFRFSSSDTSKARIRQLELQSTKEEHVRAACPSRRLERRGMPFFSIDRPMQEQSRRRLSRKYAPSFRREHTYRVPCLHSAKRRSSLRRTIRCGGVSQGLFSCNYAPSSRPEHTYQSSALSAFG